jgi:hypothetical protein
MFFFDHLEMLKIRVQICVLLCLAASFAVGLNAEEINLDNLNYNIKWLTSTTKYPIKLEKYSFDADADYKWYKVPDKTFINELENYESSYEYRQTGEKIELAIKKYDGHTHEQLSSYMAVPIAHRSNHGSDQEDTDNFEEEAKNDLFTLAYLDHHTIDVYQGKQTVDYYCNVSVLIPYGDVALNKINIELVQSALNLKMGFVDHGEKSERRHFTSQSSTALKSHKRGEKTNQLRRVKRNVVVFLQVNENIGPLSIVKSQVSGMVKNRVFCDLNLFEIKSDAEKNVQNRNNLVHSTRVEQKIENVFDYDYDGPLNLAVSSCFFNFKHFQLALLIVFVFNFVQSLFL